MRVSDNPRMSHETSLIATIAVSLAFAFIGGFIALGLRLPPLIGYLLAGVAVGPFTPGFVADAEVAPQLAEIGVILLMFGVGTHFSLQDLWAVRKIALPGAAAQIVVATALGLSVSAVWGWTFGAGLVFGLALSVASTVVLLRALESRNRLTSEEGRIAIGWLIVEDLFMILALVALPAIAPLLRGSGVSADQNSVGEVGLASLALTVLKIGAFVAVMLIGGARALPWLLKRVENTGSRELFTLAIIGVSLGVAFGSAKFFGVSFALGAFFAGVIVNQSDLSQRASHDLRPLQDAFGALFFVAVGMLFDPSVLVRLPLQTLVTVLIVVFGKSLGALAIVLALRRPAGTALTISAALAQIGEFSFILASLGVSVGLLPIEGQSLILAAALISITLNPLAFAWGTRIQRALDTRALPSRRGQ